MICAFLLFCSVILQSNDYVSPYPGTVTQIEAPATVLLAHNFADGRHFDKIDEVYLNNELYVVSDTLRTSLNYVPPEINDPDKLLLITCLKAGDDWTAGRLILIAEKP